jgi:hypothetical protein
VTRSPLSVFMLALLDGALGAGALALALAHGVRRDVLAHFVVYLVVIGLFKARDAARRLPALVAQARSSSGTLSAGGPWWLRTTRLLVGYDPWSRTERIGLLGISALVVLAFGWDDGGPFAAALFLAVAGVNATLALVAWGARLSARQLRP